MFVQEDSDLIYSMNSSVKKIPTLNFIKFETKYIETALDFMVKNVAAQKVKIRKSLVYLKTEKII